LFENIENIKSVEVKSQSMKKYPLKFLDSYTKADTDIFFGRKEEVDALYEMIFQTDILLLYGASGTGKTSLIQCGLASRFESHDWLDLYIRRGADINESLKNTLLNAGGTIAEEEDWLNMDLEETEAVIEEPLTDLQRQFKTIYLNAFRPIYLIFDQFEELYILGNKAEQQQFVENVKAILALEQPVKMIFSIREEYLGYLYDFERDVPQLLKKKLRVEPMNITKVQEVITGTTTFEDSNITVKKGELSAFTEIVFEKLQGKDEAGNPKKRITIDLPYLQVFLDKVYLEITKDNTRTADAEFSVAALENIGEIDDVLRAFLEEQVVVISQQLRPKHLTLKAEHIWKILSPFVTLDGTKEPISTEVISDKVKNTVENSQTDLTAAIIESLVKSKIIRYLETNETYEIAHDSLAAKIADKRSDEEIALLEVKRLIKSQAALKADAQELFTEKQLNFIEPYLTKLTLETAEKTLIEKSRAAIVAAKIAKETAREAELKAAQAQAKKDKQLRENAENATKKATRFSRVAIIVAVAAALAAVFAYRFYKNAQQSEDNTKIALENVKIEKRNAEVSDSLAQIDKEAALIAKAEAEEKDGIAQVKAAEALAAEETAKKQEALAKASEQKAKLALNEIAKREVKSGFTGVEQFQWAAAIEHLKSANQSEEDSVRTQVKNILTDFVIIGIYRVPPNKWNTELQPLFAAFRQTNKGVEVDFENSKGKAILLDDFEKARQLALNGNKTAARRELIQAMQKILGKDLMKSVLNKYNFSL
jgi:DNA polymerase III delta prime subunit